MCSSMSVENYPNSKFYRNVGECRRYFRLHKDTVFVLVFDVLASLSGVVHSSCACCAY